MDVEKEKEALANSEKLYEEADWAPCKKSISPPLLKERKKIWLMNADTQFMAYVEGMNSATEVTCNAAHKNLADFVIAAANAEVTAAEDADKNSHAIDILHTLKLAFFG